MATIADVAREAGVSKATVSSVFSKKRPISAEVTERVYAVAKRLGYYPNHIAVSLSLKKTMIIGLQMSVTNAGEWPAFNAEMVSGVIQVCAESGYRVLLDTLPENSDRTTMTMDPVDGVILLNPAQEDKRLDRFRQMNIPAVVIGRPNPSSTPACYVDNNNEEMMFRLGLSLLAQGHRQVLFLNAAANMTVAQDRYEGLRAAYRSQGLDFPITHHFHYDWHKHPTADEYGYQTIADTAGLLPYTVVITDQMHIAIGVMRAARELGISIPEQLSLVALGDDAILAQEVSPSLTAVDLQPRQLGAEAARMLLDLIQRAGEPRHRLVDTAFVVRESCSLPNPNSGGKKG
ncbi:LacI family transcriptional regulator [Paenibacillus sp. 598K]|nr:LacI family transcriptional regulator [Paenibacillus sp. 598K]